MPNSFRTVMRFFGRALYGTLALLATVTAVGTLAGKPPPGQGLQAVPHDSGHHRELILPAAQHEGADVGRLFIAGAFALLLFLLAVTTLCSVWLFPMPTLDRTLHGPLPTYPEPRLQPSPRQDFQRFLAEEQQQLHTYGWIDRQHGIVRLPIDVAMGEIAKRGIPGWPTPAPRPTTEKRAPATDPPNGAAR